MTETKIIHGMPFTIRTEYERKFLRFLDVEMPWPEVEKLVEFLISVPGFQIIKKNTPEEPTRIEPVTVVPPVDLSRAAEAGIPPTAEPEPVKAPPAPPPKKRAKKPRAKKT